MNPVLYADAGFSAMNNLVFDSFLEFKWQEMWCFLYYRGYAKAGSNRKINIYINLSIYCVVNKPPISDEDYINCLTAITNSASCVKSADCYSENGMIVSHDLVNRFLTRPFVDPDTLWNEVKPFIEKRNG